MSIDARVKYVRLSEGGYGDLVLIDRPSKYNGDTPGIAGQKELHFETAPEEVTALNGLDIWGDSATIMLGDCEIARRIGYTGIEFASRDEFIEAVKRYHERYKTAP